MLSGLRYFGRHGVHQAERELGSHFVVDVEVASDLAPAAASDRLEDTLSYSVIEAAVRAQVEGPSCQLLEALAGKIVDAVLALPGAEGAVVRVTKEPRLAAQTLGFTVELRRP
ncbi:MAG: dihydroneopterin aldolase [Candidatus Dormiibacterota bacterium]